MLVAEDHQQTNLVNITVDQAIRENIHMDAVWWKRNRKESPDSKHIDTKETIKYSRVGIKVKIRRKINMAKRGGFPGMGMPGNINNLMKQAQKMQRQMEENQKELEERNLQLQQAAEPLK